LNSSTVAKSKEEPNAISVAARPLFRGVNSYSKYCDLFADAIAANDEPLRNNDLLERDCQDG